MTYSLKMRSPFWSGAEVNWIGHISCDGRGAWKFSESWNTFLVVPEGDNLTEEVP
jgi:hypothetical protein